MDTQLAFEKLCSKKPNKAENFLMAKNSLKNLIQNDVGSVIDIWEFVCDTSYMDTEVHTNPEFLLMDDLRKGRVLMLTKNSMLSTMRDSFKVLMKLTIL